MNGLPTSFAIPASSEKYDQLLHRCQVRFRSFTQRSLSSKNIQAMFFRSSFNLEKDDPMEAFFKLQKQLWQQGEAVWGKLLVAEPSLINQDREQGFAVLLHPTTSNDFFHPDALQYFEDQIMLAMHEPNPEPLLAQILEVEKGKTHRFFNQSIPKSIALHSNLSITSICLNMKQLLNRPLFDHPFPALIQEECPHIAMLLPHWTWEKALIDLWHPALR